MKKYKKALNKKEYREMLDDLCSEYCDEGHYCILKEFLVSSHPSPRLLMQIKCVDKFKYERGVQEEREIGWTEAFEIWAEEGLATKFSAIYDETLKFRQVYKLLMSEE
jgi:hypothetical protein